MEFQVTSSSAATGKNDIVTRIYSPPPTLSILYESDLENDGRCPYSKDLFEEVMFAMNVSN